MCFLKVYTEGRLIVEFNFDDLLRIRSWHFAIRNHRELIPRSVIAMQVTISYVSEHGGDGGDGGNGGGIVDFMVVTAVMVDLVVAVVG